MPSKRYYVHITVNMGPNHDQGYSMETDSVDAAMLRAIEFHPSCTSVLISVIRNDPRVNLGDQE